MILNRISYFYVIIKEIPEQKLMLKKFLLLIFGIISIVSIRASNFVADKGILDARNFDFRNKAMVLKGEWEFYPGQMLNPSDFNSIDPLPGVQYITQPSFRMFTKLKNYHCGTLRLIIIVNNDFPDSIFYKTGVIYSSATHFINNTEIISFGQPSCDSSERDIIGNKILIIRNIHPLIDNINHLRYIQIIIQTAKHSKGFISGIKYPPRLGYEKNFQRLSLPTAFFNLGLLFFALSLAIIFTFYYFIKKHYKNRAKYFFLTILAISSSIKIVLSNKIYLPPLPANLFVDLGYLSIIIDFYALVHFLYYYKKGLLSKKCTIKWNILITTALIPFILGAVLRVSWLSTLSYYLVFVVAFAILSRSIYLSFKNKSPFLFLAFFTSILAALFNFISLIGLVKIYISEGVTYFIFLMAIAIDEAIQYEKIVLQNRRLAHRLLGINKYLNKIIIQRTKKIVAQSKKMEKVNQELKAQNEELLRIQKELMEKNVIIEAQSREIKDSIRYAQNFQNGVLPSEQEISKYLDNFIIYLPKYIVSGDFYVFKHFDTADYIGVFDCTGHGVPGGFLSIISYKIIDEAINYKGFDNVSDMMNYTNNELIKLMSGRENFGDGFEFGIVRIQKIDNSDYQLTFWGSRKIPLFYYNSSLGQVERHRLKNAMIGTHNETMANIEKIEIQAHRGDMLWLATDGYIDQANTERRKFGTKRFIELLSKIALLSLSEQKKILTQTFHEWKGEENQTDDITIIGIRL